MGFFRPKERSPIFYSFVRVQKKSVGFCFFQVEDYEKEEFLIYYSAEIFFKNIYFEGRTNYVGAFSFFFPLFFSLFTIVFFVYLP